MELKKNKLIYDKQKSFINFSNSSNSKINFDNQLNRLKNCLKKNNKKIFVENQDEIISFLKKDVYNLGHKDRPKFKITESILREVSCLNEDQLLKYLLHRYRYDIYPQILKSDNYPPYLQIEPTSICNYRCVFCFQTNNEFSKKNSSHMGRMTLETFKLIIDQIEGNIEFISLASRGEPLSNPIITKMLEYTNGKFLNLKINTNASLLDENKIHSILSNDVRTIVFSVDAANDELYSKLRVRGNLNKVKQNIELFNKIKNNYYSNSKIITRVSGVKVNELQKFEEVENFWKSLVDQVAFVDYCPWEDVYSDKKNNINKPCSELWRRMYIWWDGQTNPCEVDFKSKLATGLIFDNQISKIWTSKKYNFYRDTHLKNNRQNLNPCDKCVSV